MTLEIKRDTEIWAEIEIQKNIPETFKDKIWVSLESVKKLVRTMAGRAKRRKFKNEDFRAGRLETFSELEALLK